ncbi:deazaflavin-dependent oxidoreductase (nitroreductase family) [Actinoplanes octamycinicus]|uniref:Deazaflavin-dependent oxidoreductase (Nitroreductase family) n=1 Tax=Actinoplanes octamycinicus TaxID=135948 RepID=A0A7W7H4J2_9ACTN|nr:nitroreductase family deazaflavin-dependent oxidoreductase [Actinoplanes octamycinicus]MBB4743684.1 deazaflavin-dependent oxidoreductase (nitroreductase family) [Actinoplanes octamycinicus]
MIWRKFWRAVGDAPVFTPVARRVVALDRWLSRVTKGRVVALGMAPGLLLTTVGRRSGQPRQSPLQFVADGEAYVVVGSNWGGEKAPAWVHNLSAQPHATVTVGGRDIPVEAREATGDDRERLWQAFVDQWPGYRRYRETAAHRTIRIFRLIPSR